MGFAGWFGISLTAASVTAPTIILTLAVADSVHILSTMFQKIREGKNKIEAIIESLRVNLQPVFLTSITTAIGFLTMNFSDAPPFRDLGNIVATGVIAAFLFSVLFLPAIIAVLPIKIKFRKGKEVCKSCDRIANLVINHHNLVFLGTLIIGFILSLGIFRIDLNDQFVKYFSKQYDIRKASDFIEENLTGLDVIEYSLDSKEEGGISNPDYLKKVEKFTNWYKEQASVVHVSSITDIMKRLNKNMNGKFKIPKKRELAAQYLLLYEMSLPYGLDLNNQLNVDKSASRMVVTLKDVTSKDLRAIDEKARQWLKKNTPDLFTYGSGLSIIWANISERNINSMLVGAFWALILISAIMIFALKNFKLGLISLIPNLSPACIAFGIWGIFVGKVGLGLSVIVSLTLGIVVDDTVHFLSKYLRARRELEMNTEDAIRYSFHTVGSAMWITTIALVSGFSVFAFSGYHMNSDMGIMTAITISLALAMDFLLLPTILIKIEEKKNETIKINSNSNYDANYSAS
ncbi:RND transporter, partial [bacterium B13(2017)]